MLLNQKINMHKTTMNLNLDNETLFKECVEVLNAEILPWDESFQMKEKFKKLYPITTWGKINWDKISIKIEVGYNPNNVISAYNELIPTSNTVVYILWSDATIPIIKVNLEKVLEYFDYVTCVSFEKFIFNPTSGLIIEILTNGMITTGLVSSLKQNPKS